MAPYLGDFAEDATVNFKWNTNDSDGASITRSTDGTIYVYKDNATGTEVTTGVTDSEDFDSMTGVHHCNIVTTNAFYATGSDYTVVLKTSTIDTQVVNAVLASFSIQNRYQRGTDSAALAATALTDATWTDAAAQALIDWINGGRLDLLLDAIPTTAMRGTDSAALAATALTDATWTDAAAGALIDWVNGGRLDLLLDAIPTTAMRGTDSANTVVPDIAGTAATLHGITDGKVDSVQADTTAIVADTGTDGVVVAAASKTGYALSAAGIDGILDEVVEGSITLRQATNLFLAVLTGKTSGGGTTTLTFRDTGDSKNRLVVTVDANQDRTAVGTRDGA